MLSARIASIAVSTRRLIITADDFGAAIEVNQAVEVAHRQGVLTAASLMVGAPGSADAVARAAHMAGLRVGLHIVLVDGRPVLPATEVPALVDGDGRFISDMAAAGARMFFRPDARRQLAAEIEAQFAAFAATGLTLDHVNAHKHFHLHPSIAGLIVAIGRRHGMSAVRAPIEPAAPLIAAEPGATVRGDPLLALWAGLARRRFRAAGLLVPDQVFGLRWSGAMTAARLRGLIDHLPTGLSEIYLHPATDDGFEGAAPGYLYAQELAALLDPAVAEAIGARGMITGGFQDMTDASPVQRAGPSA